MRSTPRTLLLVLLVSACSPSEMMMMPPPGHPLGATCVADADCASSLCFSAAAGVRFCSATCTADADCAGATGGLHLVCGVAPSGASQCVPPCGQLRYTCMGGVSTSCDVVTDDSHCIDCRCADTSLHCVRDVGCMPPGDVGAPCNLATDCRSHDCSTFAGVCRVSVGAACTTDNCDQCLHLPSGATHCARECASAAECNGDACVGSTALAHYDCRPSSCTGTACTVAVAPHEVGQACHADTDCRSGLCFSAQRCVGSECIGEGWCTTACTDDAGCPSDSRCVTIPCAAGQTTKCGTVCLPSCTGFTDCGIYGGACAGVEDTMRMIAMVCDVRHDSGDSCTEDRECVSAHCTTGHCD